MTPTKQYGAEVTFAHAVVSGGNAVSGLPDLAESSSFGTGAAVSSIVGRHYYIAPGASSRSGLARFVPVPSGRFVGSL